MWYDMWNGSISDDISTSAALKNCDMTYYPCVSKTLKLLATTLVSSCEAERLFSQMELVKSNLRSTKGSVRLDSLLRNKVHRDIPIDIANVVDHMTS